MLKLKLQYFAHLMCRADSFEKSLMLGKIEGRRRVVDRGWDGWMASATQWTWVWTIFRRQCKTGKNGVLAVHGARKNWIHWMTEQQWTTTINNNLDNMQSSSSPQLIVDVTKSHLCTLHISTHNVRILLNVLVSLFPALLRYSWYMILHSFGNNYSFILYDKEHMEL